MLGVTIRGMSAEDLTKLAVQFTDRMQGQLSPLTKFTGKWGMVFVDFKISLKIFCSALSMKAIGPRCGTLRLS